MMTLTEEKALIIKEHANIVEKEEGCEKLYLRMDVTPYCELLDLNANTVLRLSKNEDVYGDMAYTKVTMDGETKYYTVCHTYVDGEQITQWNAEFCNDTDILGMFAKNGEKTLTEFFNQTTDKIVEYIKENDVDLYQEMRQLFVNELEVDDLTDGLREEVGECYIEDNPSRAFSTALDYMSDYDTRDAIKDAIDKL